MAFGNTRNSSSSKSSNPVQNTAMKHEADSGIVVPLARQLRGRRKKLGVQNLSSQGKRKASMIRTEATAPTRHSRPTCRRSRASDFKNNPNLAPFLDFDRGGKFSYDPHVMATKAHALDIPVSDLPFEAGSGFTATVENGIAHIVVNMALETTKRPKKSLGKWARENAGIFKGVEEHAPEDPILSSILAKHAPELLDRR